MIPLRLDDLGASSKLYERHRGKWWAYRELAGYELDALARWLRHHGATMTLAITACWVEEDGALTPFHFKYPELAGAVAYSVRRGVFDIACHGLTHCVPGRHVPSWKPWKGNRQWHREFIDAIPVSTQQEHLRRAKGLLEERFMVPVTTLVPPGNAISENVALWALEHGYDRVVCRARGRRFITDDSTHVVLHDRELVERGVSAVMDALPPADYQAISPARAQRLSPSKGA